jgi:hypothetical protein
MRANELGRLSDLVVGVTSRLNSSVASFGTLFGHSRLPTEIMIFGGLTVFFLSLGSTAIYTYTPELYPTEIRATAMGIASAWGTRRCRDNALNVLDIYSRSTENRYCF